ncbi:MAG: helicase-exonuclease AddAB subunit AddA [Lachnospiraceae bacterium]
MGTKWTPEQQKVIETRNADLLVSAAAGSGKTAVLVERICQLITDNEHPVDVDQLLVVTFTNAAASEMKERISNQINDMLIENPTDENLIRQSELIQHAHIMTIDSFCLELVRNYFSQLDLDPGFRIAENAQLELLKQDAMRDVLEQAYADATPEFLEFVEAYAPGKSDRALEEHIFDLYRLAMSHPRPDYFLDTCLNEFRIDSIEELSQVPLVERMTEDVGNLVEDLLEQYESLRQTYLEEPEVFEFENGEMFLEECETLHDLDSCEQYHEYQSQLETVSVRTVSRKTKGIDSVLNGEIKNLHEQYKVLIGDIKASLCYGSAEQIVADIQSAAKPMEALVSLTKRFRVAFSEKKKEARVIDFVDGEHFALQLLVQEYDESGRAVPSVIAKELSGQYYEIFIDEYQDSNMIQETILTSVSKEYENIKNMFMVGDVKQSIYKFRQADSKIFMERYHRYHRKEDEREVLIELRNNFRSRPAVQESINAIFYQLMQERLGGIQYTKEVALVPKERQEETEEIDDKTEFLLLDMDSDEEVSDRSKSELEAQMIANRIQEMTAEGRIQYRDIAILLRSAAGRANVIAEVLQQNHIPCFTESQTGYFSAVEIKVILNLLSIIDNPLQDIPFAGVLRSPIVGLRLEELAKIKIAAKESEKTLHTLYDVCRYYYEYGDSKSIHEKLQVLFGQLEEFWEAKKHENLHDFIWFVLERTGYFTYLCAMPDGEERKNNVYMLLQEAVKYEQTSFKGLFRFIQYMNQLRDYEMELDNVRELPADANVVRIMTIHKSKGLEFPVVILAETQKRFNMMDANRPILMHSEYHLGPMAVDLTTRQKSPTIYKNLIKKQMRLENIGEELRILYVALTRAKEKLIITGVVKGVPEDYRYACETRKKESDACAKQEKTLEELPACPYTALQQCNSYLDFFELTWKVIADSEYHEYFRFQVLPLHRMIDTALAGEILHQMEQKQLKQLKVTPDEGIQQQLSAVYHWEYPYLSSTKEKGKYSVSELKKQSMMEQAELTPMLLTNLEEEPKHVPNFISRQEESVTGAMRGTIVHTFMEHSSFADVWDVQMILAKQEEMVREEILSSEEVKALSIDELLAFAGNECRKRMAVAEKNQCLYREQQFLLGVPMKDVMPDKTSEELVMLQGIIDVYWEEEDGIVLLDYKTDSIRYADELVARYRKQMEIYERALMQITGKPVKEKILYSFHLNQAVVL